LGGGGGGGGGVGGFARSKCKKFPLKEFTKFA